LSFKSGNNLFNQFSSTICGVCITASNKTSDIGFEFITKGELDVVAPVTKLFRIVTFLPTKQSKKH